MMTSEEISIRRASGEDENELVRFEYAFDNEISLDETRRFFGREGHHLLLGYLGGRPAGFLSAVEEQFQPERFRSSFQRSLALTEARILRQEGASSSETTLLALAIGWGRVFWGSFGDSRLYAEPRSEQINPADGNYLGGTARSVSILAGAMSWGELEGSIAQDRRCRLMLCTDGVPESGGIAAEEWDPQAICSILAAASDVTSAAANLAKAALDRGGSDNLCAIVLDLPRSSG